MKRFISTALAVALSLPAFQIGAAFAQPNQVGEPASFDVQEAVRSVQQQDPSTYSHDSVIVTMSEPASSSTDEQIASALGATDASILNASSSEQAVAEVAIPDGLSVEQAIQRMASVPGVESVQQNNIFELVDAPDSQIIPAAFEQQEFAAAATVSDPYANAMMASSSTPNQWYLDSVGARTAWNDTKVNGTVTVAIFDTGINFAHSDLAGVIDHGAARQMVKTSTTSAVPMEYSTSETAERYAHGSHIAGIISAQADNGFQFAGVSYNANILPIKVFFDVPSGSTQRSVADEATLIAAFNYVFGLVDAGRRDIRVINLSLGGPNINSTLADCINKARSQYGILVVCAAGNDGVSTTVYPSDLDSTLSVIALDPSNNRASYSNFGAAKSISAPGTAIWSTYIGGTNGISCKNGTSMAAPIVSAAAAMLWAKNPNLSVDEVKSILTSTATDLGSPGFDAQTAWGKLNIPAALAALGNGGSSSGGGSAPAPSPGSYFTPTPVGDKVTVYRLYNHGGTSEHLYTSDANEARTLARTPGWTYEGIAWYAPAVGAPVWRLFDPAGGTHLYTTDANEAKILTGQRGWKADNMGYPLFSSGGNVQIYRLFNTDPAYGGLHHLTTDIHEYGMLPSINRHEWVQEGHKLSASQEGNPNDRSI